MKHRLSSRTETVAAFALQAACGLVVTACSDGGGPGDPPDPIQLAVTPIVDTAEFQATGTFALNLVPSDNSGRTFLTDPWTIGADLDAPTSTTATTVSQGVEAADTTPVAAAILIDDSGSMRFSDPDRVRAIAAQLFWRDILPGRPGNMVALLDFGKGGTAPSPGFVRANLLVPFTSDEAALTAGLDQIEAIPGGATPLYEAAFEVVKWMDTTTSRDFMRTLVVITDGGSSDPAIADSLFELAVAYGVRIFAVGLGSAADAHPASPEAEALLEMTRRTGGIYAAAEPPQQLEVVLRTLARSTSPARLLLHLQLSSVPAAGTPVRGTVSISGERGTATAEWSFKAP